MEWRGRFLLVSSLTSVNLATRVFISALLPPASNSKQWCSPRRWFWRVVPSWWRKGSPVAASEKSVTRVVFKLLLVAICNCNKKNVTIIFLVKSLTIWHLQFHRQHKSHIYSQRIISLCTITNNYTHTTNLATIILVIQLREHGDSALYPVVLVALRGHVDEAHEVTRVTRGRQNTSVIVV